MHPDFKAADATASYEHSAVDSQAAAYTNTANRGIRADVEPDSFAYSADGGWVGESQSPFRQAATLQDAAQDHREESGGGLDYYDTGKDFESRGVVDEDGKQASHWGSQKWHCETCMPAYIVVTASWLLYTNREVHGIIIHEGMHVRGGIISRH